MAYRFLLEVPETLAEAASVAVDQVGDSQVVLVRPSHGLGVDDHYVDMTVASHTLQIVNTLFDWYQSLPSPQPDIRIVLHGGERHPLADVGRDRMVALIRRDQPWVERSIPHVGDHEPTNGRAGYSSGPGAPAASLAVAGAPTVAVEEPAGRSFEIRGINYVLIQVNDLERAEAFYPDFLAMSLLGRLRRNAEGTLVPMPQDFSWQRALQTGELPDVTLFSNGPLTLAVQRVGLGVVLGKGAIDLVSVGVDARTFASIKGEVLMRPLTVLRTSVASFVFRDPFGVNWEIAILGSVPLIPA
jgi:catechol 2,3-dioxygenase-like lactoylglutathione lyase family enzyme